MTERQRNRKYIGKRLNDSGFGYTLNEIDLILDICEEQYTKGLQQGHLDKQMDSLTTIDELRHKIEELNNELKKYQNDKETLL